MAKTVMSIASSVQRRTPPAAALAAVGAAWPESMMYNSYISSAKAEKHIWEIS